LYFPPRLSGREALNRSSERAQGIVVWGQCPHSRYRESTGSRCKFDLHPPAFAWLRGNSRIVTRAPSEGGIVGIGRLRRERQALRKRKMSERSRRMAELPSTPINLG